MKITNLIRIIIFTILGSYFLYCSYLVLFTPLHPTYLDCGVVKSKSSDEVAIKHGSRTELYLNIQFDKTGFKSINCSETTYFGTKVGERVCFDLDIKETVWVAINKLVGIIVLFCLGMVILIGICIFLFDWS